MDTVTVSLYIELTKALHLSGTSMIMTYSKSNVKQKIYFDKFLLKTDNF